MNLDELIAKKLQKDKSRLTFKEIEVPSYEGTLLFERPTDEEMLECMSNVGDGTDMVVIVDAYDKLIYNCCPTLKKTELHEQLSIADPRDVVKTLFDLSDRMFLGNELTEFSGIGDIKEKIKK